MLLYNANKKSLRALFYLRFLLKIIKIINFMNQEYTEIRNIAIIAHVDHGKTTLTDALMKECGVLEEGFSMDTNDLERSVVLLYTLRILLLFTKVLK